MNDSRPRVPFFCPCVLSWIGETNDSNCDLLRIRTMSHLSGMLLKRTTG